MKKAILLNDTSYENHHGCSLVINNINTLLNERGIKIVASNPVGFDWQKNRKLLEEIKSANVIVINGEGTIHHNSPAGKRLLEIAEMKVPVVLINASYQSNDSSYAEYLEKLSFISARESFSANEIRSLGIETFIAPDLTLYTSEKPALHNKNSNKIGFTDSVYSQLSLDMLNYSKTVPDGVFIPIISGNYKIRKDPGLEEYVNWIKFHLKGNFSHIRKRAYVCSNEIEYLKKIAELKLLVGARFHSLCFAIKAGTPFLAISSNSHKIEGMLSDIGITGRIIEISKLPDVDFNSYEFTPDESLKIDNYVQNAQTSINQVFDRIAEIAGV